MRALTIATLCVGLGLVACDPSEEDGPGLAPLTAEPDIRVEALESDPNFVVVEDLSEGFFSRVWDMPGATPSTSTRRLDTVLYTSAGQYEVRLYASASGGGGTATAVRGVAIANDAETACNEEITLLTGGCDPLDEKCWTFSQVAGAVSVGPVPGSDEFFSSPEGGLQDAQYDDSFCFKFDGAAFAYLNEGLTVDPDRDFAPVPYEPLEGQTYQLIPGGGFDGETRVVMPAGNFIGLLNTESYFDIITLTETELVVRSPILGEDGVWFELYFVAR